MPQHDIIDNRNEKLIEHIIRILPSSERAKFAVKYVVSEPFKRGKKCMKYKKTNKIFNILCISPNRGFYKIVKVIKY